MPPHARSLLMDVARRWLTAMAIFIALGPAACALSAGPAAGAGPSPGAIAPSPGAGVPTGGDERTRASEIRRVMLDARDARVLVVAHRGHHRDHPENSLPAILAAAQAGAAVAEIDVRRTADGQLVLMHDETIDRTTTGTGRVDAMTLEQLRAVQLMDALRPTALRAPTLAEAFEAAAGRIMLNLDPKGVTVRELARAARQAGAVERVILKERWDRLSPADLAWLGEQPDLIFMPICRSVTEAESALAVRSWHAMEIVAEDADDPLLSAAFVAGLRQRGVRVWVNTLWNGRLAGGLGDEQAALEPCAVFDRVRERGFGMIQTDLPELAAACLNAPRAARASPREVESTPTPPTPTSRPTSDRAAASGSAQP